MFMVKGECANIKNLLKVKIMSSKNYIWFSIISAFMFLSSLAVTVAGIIQSGGKGINFYAVTDYSTSFFFGIIIACIILMIIYRSINDKLSVFPQTNNARFITSQALSYIFTVLLGLTALVIYLLYNGAIKIVSLFYKSVHLVIDVDAAFIAAGLIVFLLYSFIIIAVIDLIGVILRKWTHYAAIAFIALFAAAVVNITSVIEYAPRAFAFLVKEPSFGLFTVKALVIWLAITAVSLVINRFTIYHKKQGKPNKKVIIACSIISAAVIAFGIPLILFNNINSGFNTEPESVEERVNNYFYGSQEIRVDVSHLPRGSSINLELIGDNIHAAASGGAFIYGQNSQAAYLSGTDALENIQSDTLVLMFRPPFHNVNGFELAGFANPRLNAYLEGNTLYVEYTAEDSHAVIIPIWSIVGQFDIFRDKGLVTENPLGFYSCGNSTANIFITME